MASFAKCGATDAVGAAGDRERLHRRLRHHYGVMVIGESERIARVAVPRGMNEETLAEVRFTLGRELKVECAAPVAPGRQGDTRDGDGVGLGGGRYRKVALLATADGGGSEGAPLLVEELLREAVARRASDIHVEPVAAGVRVRMRVDGRLVVSRHIGAVLGAAVVARLKILADLDIAELRRPQDGRIRLSNGWHALDVRVSTLPAAGGESVVLRLLDAGAVPLALDALGFSAALRTRLREALDAPGGLVLVTGPTGCGKTTTLYAALNHLNTPERHIVTIEDPVEYRLDGILQTPVRPDLGLDFAAVFRTVLRQDPDVVMVGEIRDGETAGIALRAAMTGHLVLSTLHTVDAAGAVIRLRDLGVAPYQIAAALRLVVAQRLLPRRCPACGGAGERCESCGGRGFRGRVPVGECLPGGAAFADRVVASSAPDGFRDLVRAAAGDMQAAARERLRNGEVTAADIRMAVPCDGREEIRAAAASPRT